MPDQQGRLSLAASLVPTTIVPACDAATQGSICQGAPANDGLAYRAPAPGILKVCATTAENCATDAKPLATEQAPVPQFGTLHVLRLHNGWGEDNELGATFSKAGLLTSFHYGRKSAPAVAASALFADVAGQGASFADALKANRQAQATAATAAAAAKDKGEIDAIQHRIDLLTKQAELARLQAPADPAADARNAEISDLTGELALLRLKKERKDLLDALGKSE
jgi:hypothetical protein